MRMLEIRGNLQTIYDDVFTPEAVSALHALAPLDDDRKAVMAARIGRRAARARKKQRIAFLDPDASIPRTQIKVQDARDGAFVGSEIPADLQRQWIQGTGPAAQARRAASRTSIRNVAYALLSGADGWMFDGEDALGQVSTMSLDNQRNLKLAIHRDPVFLKVAEQVAAEMNQWAQGFFGRPIIDDWRQQLDFTTKIFRARGLHLDDRHVRHADGAGFSASIVDAALYVVNNHERAARRRRVAGAVPAEDPDRRGSGALERHPRRRSKQHLGLPRRHDQGLRARRADRGVLPADGDPRRARQALRRLQHRPLGLHQQRLRRDGLGSGVRQPEHRRHHDDLRLHAELRGPRAPGRATRPTSSGQFALWQGGMEPNIPVGSRSRRRRAA